MLLEDFKDFLVKYRTSWNSLNSKRMLAHHSKDLEVRWAGPETIVSDWGFDEAEHG